MNIYRKFVFLIVGLSFEVELFQSFVNQRNNFIVIIPLYNQKLRFHGLNTIGNFAKAVNKITSVKEILV
jgi:hypothetical protein